MKISVRLTLPCFGVAAVAACFCAIVAAADVPFEIRSPQDAKPHEKKAAQELSSYLARRVAGSLTVEGRGDAGQTALANRKLPAVYTSVKGKFTHLVTNGKYWLVEQVPAQ